MPNAGLTPNRTTWLSKCSKQIEVERHCWIAAFRELLTRFRLSEAKQAMEQFGFQRSTAENDAQFGALSVPFLARNLAKLQPCC